MAIRYRFPEHALRILGCPEVPESCGTNSGRVVKEGGNIMSKKNSSIHGQHAGRFKLFLVFSLMFSALVISSCGPNGGGPSAIKIGAVLPLTGDSAAWGDQGRKGIETAVKEINDSGGINGRPIEVVYEDSQANPRLAVSAISKLISVDKVPAVVGDVVSATTLAMAPIAEEKQVVLVAPSASAPAISDAGKFIYRVWPSDLLEGSELATWANGQGYKRVAILHIATDYGLGLSKVFQQTFESLGGAVPSTQSYAQEETSFKPYLARIKSESPDAVYLISYYKDAALALKQAKEIGLNTQFFGATAVESPELIKLAGQAADGLIYPTIVDFDPTNPNDNQRTFIERFRAAFKTDPDWASSHAHDALLVIADAMRAGARSGDQIRQEIDRRREFSGVTGRIIFNEKGDVIEKPVAIKIVENGKFELFKKRGE
jgi:branched-chain amino acid transport system substrate-binding protein